MLGAGTLGWGSLPVPVPQAQWDCVNSKYKQKKRNYKNSGVVILADLKVSLSPGYRPSPTHPRYEVGGAVLLPPELCGRASSAVAGHSLESPPLSDGLKGSCAPSAWRWVRKWRGGGDKRLDGGGRWACRQPEGPRGRD